MEHVAGPLKGHDRLVALGLAALVLLGGGLRMAPGVCGVFHDDAIYVSTAQALAGGEGYRLKDVPGSPLQTKFPIIYPAVLAAVCLVWPSFPDNVLAMQIITLLCGAAAVGLAYLYLVRFGYCSPGVAAAGGLVCATLPFFLYFSVQTMAELPFALLVIAALWGLERQLDSPSESPGTLFGLGALLALPFLCRVIGATFLAAGVVVLWRSRRPLRWLLLGSATGVVPWLLWSLLGRGIWDRNPIEGYYTDYIGCWSITGVQLLGRVVSANTLLVAIYSGHLTLEGLSEVLAAGVSLQPRLWLLLGVGLVPWLTMIPQLRQGRLLPCSLAVYLLAMLGWAWHPNRFLVPILPFLAAYLLMAPAAVIRRLPWKPGRWLLVVVGLGAVFLANVWLLVCHAQLTSQTGYPLPSVTNIPVSWAAFQRTFCWVREHSRSEDVLAAGLDSMTALYTQRRAFRPFTYNPGRLFYGPGEPSLMTVEELSAILKHFRPRYLLKTPMPGFTEEPLFADVLDELRKQHPGWLVVVYEDADPRFVVYELDDRSEPGSKQANGAEPSAGPP